MRQRSLLLDAIRVAYKERIGPNDRLTLQLKSEDWDGMLIVFFEVHIQDRMKLTFVVKKVCIHVQQVCVCCVCFFFEHCFAPQGERCTQVTLWKTCCCWE